MAAFLVWAVLIIIEFFATAGLLWVVLWLLGLVGITVTWSWLLAFVIWGIIRIIKIIF